MAAHRDGGQEAGGTRGQVPQAESRLRIPGFFAVRHVFPIPTIGYSNRVPPIQTSVPGVYLVSSAQILNGTLNVNETLQLAARALPVLAGEVTYDRRILEAEVGPILLGAYS